MSGIGFFEFLLLCMIGLIVLGPERLPRVASQLGSWIGQARRMTRILKRQLEDELNLEKELGVKPNLLHRPRDDDNYSPVHGEAKSTTPGAAVTAGTTGDDAKKAEAGNSGEGESRGERDA